MGWVWLFAFVILFLTLAYQRASLSVWTVALALYLVLMSFLTKSLFSWCAWALFLLIFTFLYANRLRYRFVTKKILHLYRKTLPTMSATEREALAAGTIGWEGDLFSGNPDWNKLLKFPKPELTKEEQAFLTGPVDTLCQMINDWDITHHRADLPLEMWQFLKDQGFFGLIIPKRYGGKEFGALAHSEILTKVYGISSTVATTIAVPNSLGPAELLLHYGTQEQKDYYLPRLARGEEIPCFALTGIEAGSDASAMTDKGIVTWGEYQGQKVLGIQLNWNKRYITLAPVATVIGLAFKLYDPEHLLGKKTKLGITCALIPRETPGVVIGRRHFPGNIVFQNGPTQGKNVFIPLDWIIGGPSMVGQGWRMLMECLAAGRGISLPASGIGSGKVLAYTAGAYARIRKQFNIPIGRFEGIEEILASMMGTVYLMDSTRLFTTVILDLGEKPAVASAITKYHVTELGRHAVNQGMDLHGGKAICLGPKNYLGRIYQSIPIAITVEGANILTRSLIIFGQGAMRCHPYVFAEMEAARSTDEIQSVKTFDQAIFGHMRFTLSNFARTLILSLTGAKLAKVPDTKTRYYFQEATRFSAAFALLADMSMLILGGALKRKESLSARLGDILSYLYLLSAALKHYQDQGEEAEDWPLIQWAGDECLYQIQQRIDEILINFPKRSVAFILRAIIFPWGKRFHKPSDRLNHQVAQLFLEPSPTRYRLAMGAFTTDVPQNKLADIENALLKVIAAEPIEKKIKMAVHEKLIKGETLIEQAEEAKALKIISEEEQNVILAAETARLEVLAVDDFDPQELVQGKRAIPLVDDA